jgi:hypothetical protein
MTPAHSLQKLKDSISKKAANISRQEIGHVIYNISEGAMPTYKPEVKSLQFL